MQKENGAEKSPRSEAAGTTHIERISSRVRLSNHIDIMDVFLYTKNTKSDGLNSLVRLTPKIRNDAGRWGLRLAGNDKTRSDAGHWGLRLADNDKINHKREVADATAPRFPFIFYD